MSAKRICIKKDQQTADVGEKDPKVVINSLDYDSLANIIMFLPIPERIEMEKVCTKWKEACQLAWYDIKEYKCKSSIGRSYDNRLLTQSYLEEILLRCGNYLKELSLSYFWDSSTMPFVGDHCKNLTSLECEIEVDSLNYYADNIVQAFTQLDKLKCIRIRTNSYDQLCGGPFDLFEIINSLPEEINQIHLISEHYGPTQKIVSKTFTRFKNLQKLTLHACDFLDSVDLQEITEKTTLVYLDIRLHDIPERFFLFNKLVNLEYINLTLTTVSEQLCKLKNNLSTKVLNSIFCTCKNLKHLDLPPGHYDIAEIPRNKWINFQNLEYLGISCNIMPDLANTIVKYCKNLKHLRIHNPDYLMNETALKKLTQLENLESLSLVFHIKLSEESIITISNNCEKLKRLGIPHSSIVPSIDGDPLSSPSVLDELSKLRYLEHLNLRSAKNLEDSTIIAIANNCKNLKSLKIQRCTGITETAIVALTNLENLQKLDVTSLNITDDFIIKLKGLKKLKCSYCQNLTNAGIIKFIKNNPDLEKMKIEEDCDAAEDDVAIDLVIDADQATKNRTNGIILHLTIVNWGIRQTYHEPFTNSQWLKVDWIRE